MMKKKLLSVLLAATAGILGGCAPRAPYADAELAYARGDYAQAEGIFADYSKNRGPRRIEAMYYYGMCLARLGDLEAAEKELACASRFCEDRALRSRIIAARAEVARLRRQPELAETLYADLQANYYDVMSPEMLAASRNSAAAVDPLAGEPPLSAAGAGSSAGPLHRVRLTATYPRKADALAAAYGLNAAGIETLVVSLPQGLFTVQIGAFRNPRLAAARVEQAARAGWTAVVID